MGAFLVSFSRSKFCTTAPAEEQDSRSLLLRDANDQNQLKTVNGTNAALNVAVQRKLSFLNRKISVVQDFL